jgi:hypothetical protein
MTTSLIESINCHIKHRSKASTLNNTSRSLMLITEGTNSWIAGIDNSAKRELHLTVLLSKLTVMNLYHQKCVFLSNRLFDSQKSQCCVMHVPAEWMVWIFLYEPPYFKDDELNLAYLFPVRYGQTDPGRHRVQLVGELLLELLVRGSNPSGVGLLLESAVRGWDPTCPIKVHLSVDTGNHTADKVYTLIVT